jgi:hypothetical protein
VRAWAHASPRRDRLVEAIVAVDLGRAATDYLTFLQARRGTAPFAVDDAVLVFVKLMALVSRPR